MRYSLKTLFIAFVLFFSFVSASEAFGYEGNTDAERPSYMFDFSSESISELAALADGRRAVLLGEASHGTSEYYSIRAGLSKQLIEDHGYNFVVVEGDWDAAWMVNLYVKNKPGAPQSAREALSYFTRWPGWMWNNEEVLELIEWMRNWNDNLPDDAPKAGFYGMDVYGWQESVEYLRNYADVLYGDTRTAVGVATHCMRRFGGDQRAYRTSVQRTGEHCGSDINEMVRQLTQSDKPRGLSDERWFGVKQHARVVRQADLHLRGMLQQGPFSWNERATNFNATLSALLNFYGDESRGIAWAHNTHIGDARAMDMGDVGMHNIGQLARQEFGRNQVFALGFGTFSGQVKAGAQWEGRRENMAIPDAQPDSFEAVMYAISQEPVWLDFSAAEATEDFPHRIPHRAVGVVYNPANDARQNYVGTQMTERYDAFIFLPYTNALNPIE